MTVYAAFVRGINLGPSNKIAMPRLRELGEALGWSDVTTYINSGNVIFTSGKRPGTLQRELSGALADELGKPIDVAIRSRAQLAEVVAANPWPEGHPSKVNVGFLVGQLPAGVHEALAANATDRESFLVRDHDIYVHYRDGLGHSRLAERFSAIVKVSTTTRTLGTVIKVLAVCDRTAKSTRTGT